MVNPIGTVIRFDNVSLVREGNFLLRSVDWTVTQGEHWAILGLNGSGKTLLLSIVSGYMLPSKGIVEVLGHRFGHYDLRKLKHEIGWVSSALQERMYVSDTALETVLTGRFATIGLFDKPTSQDNHYAAELLVQMDCQHLADRLFGNLSQGEKQRILIARALMNKPRLLVLDEPCTGLDVFAREALLQTISTVVESPKPPTLLYVTHHTEEILPAFEKSLLLRKGEIYAQGSTQTMLSQPVLSSFFDAPIQLHKNDGRTWLSTGTNKTKKGDHETAFS